jgi:hypothetical protein
LKPSSSLVFFNIVHEGGNSMKSLSATTITVAAMAAAGSHAATVNLDSTSFTSQIQFQPTEADARQAISFDDTSTVGPGVEFPNFADLQIDSTPFNLFVVPVSIDVGGDFIELDYNIAGAGGFAAGFLN